MEKAEWDLMQALFEAALQLPAEQRDAYLQQHAGSDAVALEVRDLLDAHFGAASLWNTSATVLQGLSTGCNQSGLPDAGQAIGPYRVEEKIGVGGMGVIYRAMDTRLQRQVALKLLPGHLHRDESARRRFMAEARAASRLDHPNICVIHDVGETEQGRMYISMPFYEGETLATRVSRGPLRENEAIDILIQVCDGLARAHAQDIVHRDIKPANIMLTREGLVKILDFGVAKVANENLTRAGVGIGTLAYMSPEQMNGEQVDARTDIWSAGAVLYEMLSGKPAFPGSGLQQLIKTVLDESYDPLASLSGDVSPELRLVIKTAMQRNRDARYRGIADMLDDLIRSRRDISTIGSAQRRETTTTSGQDTAGFDWDKGFLDTVVNMLLPWLGPITPKVVHRYAKVSPTLDTFIQYLEDVLPDDTARRLFSEQVKFKAAMRSSPPAPQMATSNGGGNGLALSPVQLARLERSLLPQLGPIAAILIRRVAANVSDWEALCHQLSQHFSNEKAASKFLRDVAVE